MPKRPLHTDEPGSELVVFCHLRWTWVWQRPQHVTSRLAQRHDRTYFVEEPEPTPDVDTPTLREQSVGAVTRLWLQVPGVLGAHCGYDKVDGDLYASLLAEHLGRSESRTAWLYTPLALPLASALEPDALAFDVMDDLSSFKNAAAGLPTMHRLVLDRADVVFTGGRSLQRAAVTHRPDARCFPSGVEVEHYAPAIEMRAARDRTRPVAGYVGVVDERLDLPLLGSLATALPDWDIVVVGPFTKIEVADLPTAPNITYAGPRSYEDLPAVMAGFDVALMPFALNAATRSISPTKSLEYLAAGLPVVSTRVPDVVSEFGHVVELADDAAGFASACRRVLEDDGSERIHAAKPLLRWNQWDTIAQRMYAELAECLNAADEAVLS